MSRESDSSLLLQGVFDEVRAFCDHGQCLGENLASSTGQGDGPWRDGGGQPPVFGGGFVAGARRVAVARSAPGVRQLEQRLPALSPMGEEGCLRAAVRGVVGGTGFRICPHRRHHRQRSPEGERRKRGTQNQAIPLASRKSSPVSMSKTMSSKSVWNSSREWRCIKLRTV